MKKKFLSFCGAPFLRGGVVQPNMLNMPKSASVQECSVVTEVIDAAGPLKRQLNEKVENYWKSRPTNAKNDAAKELPKDKTFD